MNSKEYWQKREAANLVSNLKQEKEYERELDRIYRDMLDGVQKEIESFYARYADKEGISIADARKAVSQLDIEAYERKAKRYVKDAALDRKANGGKTNTSGYYFSKTANDEMRLYNLTMKVNRLEMLKANIGLEMIKGHAELETFMGKILRGRTEAELKRQAGILGKSVRNNAQLANSIVNASYKNATFSQRVWMYHGQMKADVGKLLENGLIQGKGVRQLTKELRKYYIGEPTLKNGKDGAKYAAERLMRTELARVQTDAQKQSFERNGFDQYTFIVNGGCCPICEAVAKKNNGHYKVKDMMPGDNAPPLHPFCRCSVAAYEDSDEYEAWLDYLDKGGTTEAWNKWKVANVKEEALRTKSGGAYGVDWTKVKSKEYTEKFNALSDNEKANRLAAQRCRNALVNRNGKNTEEIYAISLTTGKDVSNITRQHIPFGVNRTSKFTRDVSRAEAKGEAVLFIHNHPGGTPPSIADINELLSHEKAVGITAGHNGSVYYYTKPTKKITQFDLNVAIRKAKGYNNIEKYENALKELGEKFGFEIKAL